jgi:hypothetical protein
LRKLTALRTVSSAILVCDPRNTQRPGSEDEGGEFVFGQDSILPQRRRGAENSLFCFMVTASLSLRVSAGVRILLTGQRHVVGHMGAIRIMRGVPGARMSAPGSFSDMSQFSRRDAETQRILCFVSWSQCLRVSAGVRILLTGQRHIGRHMRAIRVMRGVLGTRMSAPGSFSDMNQFSRRDAEAQRILRFVS